MKVTNEELKETYEELIDVMGLVNEDKTAIEVPDDATDEFLLEKIKEAATQIDPKIDVFTDETNATLKELAEDAGPVKKTRKTAAEKKAEKAAAAEAAADDNTEVPAKEKAKRPAPPGSAGGKGKPGVIATIVSLIEGSGKKGITKAEILVGLIDAFPERPEESMKNTINVQCPNRINKEKFALKKLEGDKWIKA